VAFPQQLEYLRLWDGSPLPAGLRHRLGQEWEQVQALPQRIAQLAAERRALIPTAEDAGMKKVQQLLPLQGIGTNSAWLFGMECFGWRAFRNGKEVGALSGLTPPPMRAGTRPMSAASPRPDTITFARWPSRVLGGGCAFSPRVRCRSGIRSASPTAGAACAGLGLSPSRARCSLPCGGSSRRESCRTAQLSKPPSISKHSANIRAARLGWCGSLGRRRGSHREPIMRRGDPTSELHRRRERRQDQVSGGQTPTRIEGRVRQGSLTHSESPQHRSPAGEVVWHSREESGASDRRDDRKSLTTAAT
jgi:hypothetical protein